MVDNTLHGYKPQVPKLPITKRKLGVVLISGNGRATMFDYKLLLFNSCQYQQNFFKMLIKNSCPQITSCSYTGVTSNRKSFLWTFETSKWAIFFSAISSHCTSDLPLAVVNDKLGDAKWMTECKNAWMDVVSCLIQQWHCKVHFMERHQMNCNATFQNRFLLFPLSGWQTCFSEDPLRCSIEQEQKTVSVMALFSITQQKRHIKKNFSKFAAHRSKQPCISHWNVHCTLPGMYKQFRNFA